MTKNYLLGAILGAMLIVSCSERHTPTAPDNEPSLTNTDGAEKLDIAPAKLLVTKHNSKISGRTYTNIEWTDLMPAEDLDALLNPPEYLQDIEDGSEADIIEGQIKAKTRVASEDRYQQARVSKTIKPEFNNKAVRIPGFIVPLDFDDTQTATTFFLVPFFGACIHMPPPPPNQIIYAEYEPGIKLDTLNDPFWIEGTLSTTLIENDIATAAYSMTVDRIEPYNGEN